MKKYLLALSFAVIAHGVISCSTGVGVSRSGAAAAEETVALRVMSYNIHHGRGIDGVVDLERIAEVIRAENPDVVALQEVDRGVARTDGRDLPAELAELTGMTVHFGPNFKYQGGDYGNAVLTRFPVLQEKNTHYRMIREGEQRGVMQLVLGIGDQTLLFMNTHIDYREDDTERLLNIEQIKEIVASYGDLPVVIAGDFNDLPGSRTHRNMKATFSDVWEIAGEGEGLTYRADRLEKRIDYIWTSREIVAKKAWVPRTLASDHLPLVADLDVIFRK